MNNSEETKSVESLEVNMQATPSVEQPVIIRASENQVFRNSAESANDQSSSTLLNEMNERITVLATQLEEANRLSLERERIIDRLHQENQSLRQGELQQALLPVLRDSIRLFDDLKQTALSYSERESLDPTKVARDFQCFAETVSDTLHRHGVESFNAAEGDPFNSKDHRVLGVVQTSVKEKDRTIARTIREGFRGNLTNVRLLEAEVYRYVPDDGSSQNKSEASQ